MCVFGGDGERGKEGEEEVQYRDRQTQSALFNPTTTYFPPSAPQSGSPNRLISLRGIYITKPANVMGVGGGGGGDGRGGAWKRGGGGGRRKSSTETDTHSRHSLIPQRPSSQSQFHNHDHVKCVV